MKIGKNCHWPETVGGFFVGYGMGKRNLYLYKSLYLTYPQIVQFLTAQFQSIGNQILKLNEKEYYKIVQTASAQFQSTPRHRYHPLRRKKSRACPLCYRQSAATDFCK